MLAMPTGRRALLVEDAPLGRSHCRLVALGHSQHHLAPRSHADSSRHRRHRPDSVSPPQLLAGSCSVTFSVRQCALYRRPKLTPFSVLQNEARLEWYGTRHERSKPRASGLRKHDDADQKRDQQGSNGKNNLVGRPLVRFFEPAARSVPPSNFVLRRFLLISV